MFEDDVYDAIDRQSFCRLNFVCQSGTYMVP